MHKLITETQVASIVEALYERTQMKRQDKESIRELSSRLGVSHFVTSKVKKILESMGLLMSIGERAKQITHWNPEKSKPNPVMLTEVYRIYTKDAKSRVKVVIKKERRLPSEQLALLTFKKKGALKVTVEYANGYKRTTEVFDIAQMKEGE